MDAVGLWTISELAEWAADALAGGGSTRSEAGGGRRRSASSSPGPGVRRTSPVNGRIRELPDPRTIRWYQTSGLVDRPLALRGRTALYGPRHLAQVVAIKRLQADGHPLAAIQARLAGASDDELVRLARLPRGIIRAGTAASSTPVRARFWTARPGSRNSHEAEAIDPRTVREPSAGDENPVVQGIRLAPGLLLVLDETDPAGSALDDQTVKAVRRAAQPLVKTLQDKGLLAPRRTGRTPSNDLEEPA